MKYTPESFILQSAKNAAVLKKLEGIVLYGFDEKLIQILEQEVMQLFQTRVIRSSQADLQKHLHLLNPAMDMFAKDELSLLIVENATDSFVKILEKEVVSVKILLKGDLKSKSKLVKFAEDSKTWGSVACYESHLGTAEALMTVHLGKVIPEFLSLAQDALELKNQINIHKLLQGSSFDKNAVVLNQSIPVLALSLLDHALFNPEQLSRFMFEDVIDELSSVGFVRLLSNHALKFSLVRERMEKHDLSLEAGLQSLMPPLFFKIRPLYEKIIKSLSLDQCRGLVLFFAHTEKGLKSSSPHMTEILWGGLLTLRQRLRSLCLP